MSSPEMGNEAGEHEGLPQMDDGETHSSIAPATTAAPQATGDDAVDDVLAQLDAVAGEPLDSQIQVGNQVHHVLQGRLADLGKE